MIDYSKLNFCSFDEISELYTSEERLVYIDVANDTEFIGRFKDLPDIIVGINRKLGAKDLKVFSYETGKELLSTYGMFLAKCDPKVREKIVDRLNDLQLNKEEVKEFKLINELDLIDFYDFCETDGLLEK